MVSGESPIVSKAKDDYNNAENNALERIKSYLAFIKTINSEACKLYSPIPSHEFVTSLPKQNIADELHKLKILKHNLIENIKNND